MDKLNEGNCPSPAATGDEAESAFEKQVDSTTIAAFNAQQPLFAYLPVPVPRMPPQKDTYIRRAAEGFKYGKYLTQPEFLPVPGVSNSGSWRLAAIVHKLRSYGWPIDVYAQKNKVAVYFVSETNRRDLGWL